VLDGFDPGWRRCQGWQGCGQKNSELLSCRTFSYFSFSFYPDIPDKADKSNERGSVGER